MAYPQHLIRRRRRVLDEVLPTGETVSEAVQRVAPMVVNDPPITRPRLVTPPIVVNEPEVAGQYTPDQLVRRPRLEPSVEPVMNESLPVRPMAPLEVVPGTNSAPIAPEDTSLQRVRYSSMPNWTPVPNVEMGERPVRRDLGDSLKSEMDYREQLERYKPKSHNSRIAGIGLGALRGLQRGGLFGAIFGAGRGAIDSSADEKDARLEAIPVSDQAIERQFGQRKVFNDFENDSTTRALRNAQIVELQRKPEVEQARAQRQAQNMVMSNLRILKGQKLDPSDARHAAFLARAEAAGIFIDPEEWNNSAGNEITFTRIDPDNPTQTQRVSYNKVTDSMTPIGQAGYVQPVNSETGMTPAQTASQDIQRQGLGLRREGLGIQREGLEIRRGEVGRQDVGDENKRQAVITANAEIDRQVGELKKEQQANERLASDPNADPYAREQARRRAAQVRDRIGQVERTKKAVPAVSRPARSPQSSGVKYSPQEQEYYNRMISVGATPAEASAGVKLKFKK